MGFLFAMPSDTSHESSRTPLEEIADPLCKFLIGCFLIHFRDIAGYLNIIGLRIEEVSGVPSVVNCAALVLFPILGFRFGYRAPPELYR